MKKISISGINVNVVDKKDIMNTLLDFAGSPGIKTAYYLNAHCLNVACSDKEYREILNKSDLVYAGGQGIVWASIFLGMPLPERVNILDFLDELVKRLADKRIRIYLLGGEKDVVKNAGLFFRNKGLDVAGSRHGFFGREEEKDIVREINSLKPDILMVGMGVPKQEKWIYGHLNELDVRLCWAVGAAFEWISGYRKRAPKWMIKLGFEWLHRLYQQPRRLWARYVLGNFVFIYHILRARSYK